MNNNYEYRKPSSSSPQVVETVKEKGFSWKAQMKTLELQMPCYGTVLGAGQHVLQLQQLSTKVAMAAAATTCEGNAMTVTVTVIHAASMLF